MASEFLSTVLCSEGSHLPNISSKISELISHTNSLKSEVNSVVESGSVYFNPLLKENDNLKTRADNLLKEMTLVQENIDKDLNEELSVCSEELKTLSTSLKEIKLFLEILKQLVKINSTLNNARKRMEEKEFFECAKLVTKVQNLIETNTEKLKKIEIFKVLSEETVLTYEQLMYKISVIWAGCVSINSENDSTNSFTMTISVDVNSKSEITQILNASALLKSNLIEKKFSNSLLNKVLDQVIKRRLNSNSEINEKAVLTIEFLAAEKKPSYLEVFENIKTVIEFLKMHLNVILDDGGSFISKIGNQIATEFAEVLIKNCLSDTIPTNSEDLDKYKNVLKNAEDFEKSLQETGFLPKDSSSLLDYAKNVNVLFANKICQSYLQKARLIMKKDLHNVVTCKDIVSDVTVLPTKHKNILKEKMNIGDETFVFSQCHISKHAEEIMSLIQSIMKEIQKSLDLCAVRLFYTVRNICEMYAAIVPLHHKKFLDTLPHQVAIFHNNCLYLAHNLINIATDYYKKIPSILKDHYTILLEEALVLRSLAAETLEVAVTNQRNQLIYILRDSGIANLNENLNLDPNSEKSVRQCIRQLQILQKVWSDALPTHIYNRALGFLLDAVVEELIVLIISVEDISSQTASDLESYFNIILEKAPLLFPEPKEIHRHAKKWQKFKEFVFVIKGNLRDIDDRWANGMGPLAIEFTAEQVKHLIRALFQNSDRRAALLARISCKKKVLAVGANLCRFNRIFKNGVVVRNNK